MKTPRFSTICLLLAAVCCRADDIAPKLYYGVNPPRPVEREAPQTTEEFKKRLVDEAQKRLSVNPQMTDEDKKRLIEEYRKEYPQEKASPDDPPSTLFYHAYIKCRKAELLNEQSPEKAQTLFNEALLDLITLKGKFPKWQPMVVDYRIAKLKSILER